MVYYVGFCEQYPEYVDAYLRLAAVAQSQSDWERSLQWVSYSLLCTRMWCLILFFVSFPPFTNQLSKALSLDPKNPDALLLKSAVEMKQGNTAQSRLTLKHCLEVHPQDPPPAADLSLVIFSCHRQLTVSLFNHFCPIFEGILELGSFISSAQDI